jgi:hypothetical protein
MPCIRQVSVGDEPGATLCANMRSFSSVLHPRRRDTPGSTSPTSGPLRKDTRNDSFLFHPTPAVQNQRIRDRFNENSQGAKQLTVTLNASGLKERHAGLLGGSRQRTGRPAKRADALALRNQESDQAGGLEEDDQEQQQSQDYWPYLLVVVR